MRFPGGKGGDQSSARDAVASSAGAHYRHLAHRGFPTVMSEGAIELRRDVEATQVPSGDLVTLPKGTTVGITQSLGGTYTVHVAERYGLFRIKAEDADA